MTYMELYDLAKEFLSGGSAAEHLVLSDYLLDRGEEVAAFWIRGNAGFQPERTLEMFETVYLSRGHANCELGSKDEMQWEHRGRNSKWT